MENIQIKPNRNRRSIESLIEESALDQSFNLEAHELRKAFNQTLANMNLKNTERQREIQKLKILLKQHQQSKRKSQIRNQQLQTELNARTNQCQELSDAYRQARKRLQYLEYKFENFSDNRNLFEKGEYEQDEGAARRKLRTQIYGELHKIIVKKIEYFTENLKKLSMSAEVQQKIQSFLQQLIYLNPYSEFHILQRLKQDPRKNQPGRIRNDIAENITSQNEWKKLEKSLQKLKQTNRKRAPLAEESSNPEGQRERSVSISKRRKLFNR